MDAEAHNGDHADCFDRRQGSEVSKIRQGACDIVIHRVCWAWGGLLTSKPAGDYPEILSVGQTDFVELDELLHGAHAVKGGNPHAHRQRKESTGRPKKYGAEDAEKVQGLKKEGHSIREISAILGMSTFTVQKLLKCAEK